MKPTSPAIDVTGRASGSTRRFPITDFNFQSMDISAAHCADANCNSFRVSREYFNNEAARDFLSESAVFAVMMLTAALPLLNGVFSIVDLISH
jgi:hypothetical protein